MKKNLLVFAFLLLAAFAKAQYIYMGGCVDSSMIQPPFSFYCPGPAPNFDPVCGCDGKTYRNQCMAQNVGGVTTAQQGICGDFDIDLAPNVIVPGSVSNGYGILSIYTNDEVIALIQIYDVYGKVWYTNEQVVYPPYPIFFTYIYMDGFTPGIYYLFVTINGELQKVKLMKADLE